MEKGDGNRFDITEAIQQFLDMILEQVINGVEKKQSDDNKEIIGEIVHDIVQKAVDTVVKDKRVTLNTNKVMIQENDILKKETNASDERSITDEDKIKTEEDDSEILSMESPHLTTSDYFLKSAYLESRLSLYASLIRRPGDEKKTEMDIQPVFKKILNDYTSNYIKGENKQEIMKENQTHVETEGDILDSAVSKGHIPITQRGFDSLDADSFATRLEDCTSRYRNLHEFSVSSLRKECIDNSDVNKLTDAKVLVKADLLKGKEFPKFSKVKKVKTKYGKVKIHYSDELSEAEQERIVQNAEEMLKNAKQNKLEEKKRQREMRGSTGSRIANFFRRLSCCICCRDE